MYQGPNSGACLCCCLTGECVGVSTSVVCVLTKWVGVSTEPVTGNTVNTVLVIRFGKYSVGKTVRLERYRIPHWFINTFINYIGNTVHIRDVLTKWLVSVPIWCLDYWGYYCQCAFFAVNSIPVVCKGDKLACSIFCRFLDLWLARFSDIDICLFYWLLFEFLPWPVSNYLEFNW